MVELTIRWNPSRKERDYVSQLCLGIVVTKEYERILIGKREDILYTLEGKRDIELLHDETRPFGSFLLRLDDDRVGAWNTAVSHMVDARYILDKNELIRELLKEDPKAHEVIAMGILDDKFETGDLISKYVALRIWHGYWDIRGTKKKSDFEQYYEKAQTLVRPFSVPGIKLEECTRLTPEHPVFRFAAELRIGDKQSERYTSLGKDNLECLIVTNSLLPVKRFYAEKIRTMKKHIMKCELCGQFYVADNESYQYCSEECRKIARKENLNQRAKIGNTAEIDRLCSDANAHWANRRSKIRKSPEWTAEEVLIYEEQVKAFQTEKREMRKKHKAGQITFSELQDWLIKQHDKAEDALLAIKVTQK